MIEIFINNKNFVVNSELSIIEAVKYTGIQIPRFCYHESLSIAGNCRMCLVELDHSEKLVIACLTSVENGFNILTNTLSVKKARENILESLLANHPLDCPICDQGGECDLQDQAFLFGVKFNKIFKNRRAVEDKLCGSLIKTIMTRCIHCTRCVRFSEEIAESSTFGTLNRGESTEIGAYVSKSFDSPISGNVIDLCPVGALTAKPHAFKIRSWELRSIETIDLNDSFGSNIYVNFKESEISRILPKINKNINGNLISDKCRFSYDALNNNRLYDIFKLNEKKSKFYNWKTFFDQFKENNIIKVQSLILINESLDLKTINKLKFLMLLYKNIKLRSILRFNEYNNYYDISNNIENLFDFQSISFFICSNLKTENSILNTRIKTYILNHNLDVYSLGEVVDIKSFNSTINFNILELIKLSEGKKILTSKKFLDIKNLNFFFGESFKKRFSNVKYLKYFLSTLNNRSNSVVCHHSANSEANFWLGIKNINFKDLFYSNNVFLLNLDDSVFIRKAINSITNSTIFWLNTHFSFGLSKNITAIPIASKFFETEGIYINLKQQIQQSQKSISSFKNSININSFFKTLILNEKVFKLKYLDFVKEIKQDFENIQNFNFSKRFNWDFYSKNSYFKISKYFLKSVNKDFNNNFIKHSYTISTLYLKNYY